MFTPGGQTDHLTFAGIRGGGKGGGGGGGDQTPYLWQQQTAVDPQTGRTFTASPGEVQYGAKKSAADQLAAFQDQQNAAAKTASDQAAATAAQTAAQNETTFQGKRQSAYDQAMQDTMRAFQTAGVDPNQYQQQYITPGLQRQYNSIQDLDPNPQAAFDPNLGQSIVNQATADRRTQFGNQFNAVFNPNYANNAVSDQIAQPYTDQILAEQFDPLRTQLMNASKRGTLNDVGYQSALTALGQKESAARSQIGTLGQNILATDRSGINDIISGGRSDIAGLGLGQTPDIGGYQTRASSLANQDVSNFGGALRSAVGGTQFADITDLLNTGGAAQGATNPRTDLTPTAAGAGTLPADPNDPTQQKRGLGNVGAF